MKTHIMTHIRAHLKTHMRTRLRSMLALLLTAALLTALLSGAALGEAGEPVSEQVDAIVPEIGALDLGEGPVTAEWFTADPVPEDGLLPEAPAGDSNVRAS